MMTTQLVWFPKISLSHLVLSCESVCDCAVGEIKFNWAILGFVLVCCFFPSLTTTLEFFFPQTASLHFKLFVPKRKV